MPTDDWIAGVPNSKSVNVYVTDYYGNIKGNASNSITMSLVDGPGTGATLTTSWMSTIQSTGGMARFYNPSVDIAGSGYTLSLTASGLTSAVSDPFNVIISSSPVHYYRFNETSYNGTSKAVLDSITTTVKSATTFNGPTSVATGINSTRGISFDSSLSQYVKTAANIGITGASAKTFTAFINPSTTSQIGTIISHGTYGASAYFQLAYYYDTLYFQGYGNDAQTATLSLSPDTWYHVAITYDGNYIKIYLNGTLVNST
ncbi:MAG: hypothetical protein HY072_01825 [Deltaproteobacteria bacterium]|nr:hypothetical protein [Deltaproteobacteria bacterium]